MSCYPKLWIAVAAVAGGASVIAACGGAMSSMTSQTSTLRPVAISPSALPLTAPKAAAPKAPAPTAPAPTAPPVVRQVAVPEPAIQQRPIPFDSRRKEEMAAYSLRHYGEDTFLLSSPKVIVEHYTQTTTAQAAFDTFAPDVRDSEFHELPNTCAHYLVEPNGAIEELVPISIRCRHTVGLNWTAIGIENVGLSDQEILNRPAQLAASLALTRWLRCEHGIPVTDVIGHNESLSSPYHHELVPAFQHQTHSDWNRADMTRYRAMLSHYPCS